MNYIIIICNTYNITVINNNYGSLQDLILLSKFPCEREKKNLRIYRQFGQAPPIRFAGPTLILFDED